MLNQPEPQQTSSYIGSAFSAIASFITWPIRALSPSAAAIPTAPPPPPMQKLAAPGDIAKQLANVQLRATKTDGEAHLDIISAIQKGVHLKPVVFQPMSNFRRDNLLLLNAKQGLKPASLRQLATPAPSNNVQNQITDALLAVLDKRRAAIAPLKVEDDPDSGWDSSADDVSNTQNNNNATSFKRKT